MTQIPSKAKRNDNRIGTAHDADGENGSHDDDVGHDRNCEDSGVSGSDGEESFLIKRNTGSPTAAGIHRVSSNCHRPTVSCPTCKGKGKLSQAQSDTMVALIPMHDRRLKPRRTTLKLIVAFCVILVVGALCFAFLYPRKVNLSVFDITLKNTTTTSTQVIMNVTATARINNTNFFTVEVSNLTVQILFFYTNVPHEVGNAVLAKTTHFGIRETKKIGVPMTTKYTGKDARIIKRFCFGQSTGIKDNTLQFPIKVSMTATLKYWMHSEQISSTSQVYYIECQPILKALKVKEHN
eukprot:Seg949.8 transcript_id=Seg949.8/GoldUCD/mRNA.D3Y31 product="Transmembrane protein 106B" protein_id=Seg949.8/GoldUCD/D3Y31